MSRHTAVAALLTGLALAGTPAFAITSTCYGTVSRGRLQDGVALPVDGPNFTPYSRLGVALGRTHVDAQVAEIVADAYASLARRTPEIRYVYGESGWPSGGRFRPHRSHQNGLSVDFFVPVRDADGRSVALPTGVGNQWGYDIDFDADARWGAYRIDFDALAEHLLELHRAATARGLGIAQVIFDTAYLPRLFATAHGADVRRQLHFMQGKPWVRHDEHYHVDFAVPCKP